MEISSIKKGFATLGLLLCLSPLSGMAQYATGILIDPAQYERSSLKQATLLQTDYRNLPPAASIKTWCPLPGNQLKLQTSAGWAAAYGAMTLLEAKRNGWTDPRQIAGNAFSPVYNYSLVKPETDEDCSSPVYLSDLLNNLQLRGAPRYQDFLTFCPNEVPEAISQKALSHKQIDFNRLYDDSDKPQKKINAIKKAISEQLPVVTAMHCPPSFARAEDFWRPTELMSTSFPGQALVVVSYDDQKYGGAFEVLNSWGRGWGDGGYTWILYQDFIEFFPQAFELFETSPRGKNQTDLAGSLTFQLESGQQMVTLPHNQQGVFKMAQPWSSGTRFRILVSNNEPAYLYAFGSDATEQVFPIFPSRKWTSAYLPYRTNHFNIPGEQELIELDATVGKDYFCFVYSLEKIDIEGLLSDVSSANGSFADKVRHALLDKLVPEEYISWGDKGIIFQATSHGRTAIVVLIEIDHIP